MYEIIMIVLKDEIIQPKIPFYNYNVRFIVNLMTK